MHPVRQGRHAQGDIADPATADRIIGAALARFGRIDTLVNNAGMSIAKPFTDHTPADYATVVGVNLGGFFWVTQRAVAGMTARYGGHVVNVSATLAEVADSGTPAVLAALAKSGLAAATGSLAIEYVSLGIRVNAVSPGVIQTPAHRPDSYGGLGDRLPPLGRPGQVSDVVHGVFFLGPRHTSPARSCTSTAASSLATDSERTEPEGSRLMQSSGRFPC